MTDPQQARGRRIFIALAVLFAAPLVAAYLFYFMPQWRPEHTTNYGQLVSPSRPLPEALLAQNPALKGKWSYVYLGAGTCGTACEQKLYQIRQTRILLNEKRVRVQRIYAAPDAAALTATKTQLEPLHPDLLYLDDSSGALRSFLAPAADAQALYLFDPLGNWLMVYPGDAEYQGILKDIKKLLRHSQIG